MPRARGCWWQVPIVTNVKCLMKQGHPFSIQCTCLQQFSNKLINKSSSVFNLTYRIHLDAACWKCFVYTSVLNHREQQPQLLQPTPPRILPTPTMEGTYPETEKNTVFLLSSLFGEPIAQGIIKRWILSSLLWEKRLRHQ